MCVCVCVCVCVRACVRVCMSVCVCEREGGGKRERGQRERGRGGEAGGETEIEWRNSGHVHGYRGLFLKSLAITNYLKCGVVPCQLSELTQKLHTKFDPLSESGKGANELLD